MAFPTIPTSAAGRIISAVQADTSGTRTFPNLSGLTKNSGDLLIAIVIAYQTTATGDAAFSGWSGGFTEFLDRSSATTMAIGAAYKWSTGSETGQITVTQAATITGHATMILMSIPGAHATTPPEGSAKANGTGAAADPASFDPSAWGAEDTLWIAVGASGETSLSGTYTGIASAPANYSDYYDTGMSADAIGAVEGAVAFRQLNAASEDVGTFSVDISSARNSAVVIAVRPIPPTPTQTDTARVSLASAGTPYPQVQHSLVFRARVQSDLGVLRAQLWQGGTQRAPSGGGYLESNALTTSLADYSLNISDSDAANITDYSNLEIRFWGYNAHGVTNVFEIAGAKLRAPVANTTPVSKTLTASYNIVGQVSKTLTASYAIQVQVSKALTASYALQNQVSKALTASYNIVQQVSKALVASYNIIQQISKDLVASYEIISTSSVSKDLVASYTIQNQVSKALAASYTVLNEVSKALTASYNLQVQVSKDLVASYNIIQQITKALTASYSVNVSVSKNLVASYSIFSSGVTSVARISLAPANRPSPQENHSIVVRARVTQGGGTIRVALYDGSNNIIAAGYLESGALTGSLADYTLNIDDADAADITQYDNLELRLWGFATSTPATFQVAGTKLVVPAGLANVKKNLTSSYNIRLSVSKDLTASYAIRSAVSKNLTASYNIVQQISKALTASYQILSGATSVSQSLVASYNINLSVSKSLVADYRVIVYGPRGALHNLIIPYDVAPVQKSLTASYGIGGPVSKSLVASYNINVSVSKGLTASYTVKAAISKALAASYNVRTVVSKALAASYNLRTTASKNLVASYNIFTVGQVGKSLVADYTIRVIASKALTASYTVRTSTSKNLVATYSIAEPRVPVSQSLVVSYTVFATVTKNLVAVYEIVIGIPGQVASDAYIASASTRWEAVMYVRYVHSDASTHYDSNAFIIRVDKQEERWEVWTA